MKLSLAVACVLGALAQASWGSTVCTPGTLSTYIALGPGGCTIGTDTLGAFQTRSGQNNATQIDPSLVSVTPSGTGSSPTLTFAFTAQTQATLESIFSYRLSTGSFTGSSIMGSNSSTSGDGSVTQVQNLCGNGSFGADGVSVCSGVSLDPLVISAPDMLAATFNSVTSLSVTDDFTFDGGSSGSASAGNFRDRFTATGSVSSVPEPATLPMVFVAVTLVLAGGLRNSSLLKKATLLGKQEKL